MTIRGKICGLTDEAAVTAAVGNGAAFVGFVFYPPSPRNVSPERAAVLAAGVPKSIEKVGLFVDPSDELIREVLDHVALDWLQLHGSESPARVREIREKFGVPVLKAVKIAEKSDIASAKDYETVADMLLFDAKAPKTMANALPGGNGLVFDWRMLAGLELSLSWMLAGGLNAENVAEAVRISGARVVDASSGVEFEPGRKDPAAIADFLAAIRAIETD